MPSLSAAQSTPDAQRVSAEVPWQLPPQAAAPPVAPVDAVLAGLGGAPESLAGCLGARGGALPNSLAASAPHSAGPASLSAYSNAVGDAVAELGAAAQATPQQRGRSPSPGVGEPE